VLVTDRAGAEGRPPILVTGLPRSGTSWIGKMLAASGEVVYVNEPLNPQHPPGRSPGVLNADVSHRYQYICADNEDRWAAAFADTARLRYHLAAELRRNHRPYDLAHAMKYGIAFTVGRLLGRRALFDDPFAVMSAAWFAERLGCQVIVCVRQPVAYIASREKLGWTADLQTLLDQPFLLRDLLGPYTAEMRRLADSPDRIARSALLWRMTYATLAELAERHPGRVHVWRYEDLATEPVSRFRELYSVCELTWTERTQRRVVAATTGHRSADKSHSWSVRGGLSRTAFRPMNSAAALHSYRERLTPAQIERARKLTADVSRQYYESEDFE
jgi:hypothetical protein